MPSREEVTYFGAGPAGLPTNVLENAAAALVNFNDTGLGIAEHSHRSKYAFDILKDAKKDLATFLDIPNDYEILFMAGGGSGQFSATALNLVAYWVEKKREEIGVESAEDVAMLQRAINEDLKIDYIITGSWSLKAAQEAAKLFGENAVNIVADSRKINDGKFGKIPEESTWNLSKDAAMVYYCDNETVDGVEFPAFPKILEAKDGEDGPIVCADMSSNILSRRVDIRKFSVIFFGAQKNLGTAGVTVVVVKKSLLPPATESIEPDLLREMGLPNTPVVFDYATIAKANSLYNTLSIFDLYIAGQVLKNSLKTFPDKIDGQEKVANRKAKLIYDMLEKYPEAYKIVPDKAARSRMNICFRIAKGSDLQASEKAFLSNAVTRGLHGLGGHRSVGGIRASNYNAVSEQGVELLVRYLQHFAEVSDLSQL